jgi:hypothetical protein
MTASSFTFSVSTRTESPTKLHGTSSDPNINLEVLAIDPASGSDRTIKKSNVNDKINVTSSEFSGLDGTSTPFSVTFTGDDSNGNFVVATGGISINGGPPLVARLSDFAGLAPSAATGTEDA